MTNVSSCVTCSNVCTLTHPLTCVGTGGLCDLLRQSGTEIGFR
jgi:hypothetical protein